MSVVASVIRSSGSAGSNIGGLITDDDRDFLIPLHIRLAMLTLTVAEWLPLHAAQHRPDSAGG